jgi:hypothetical protein
MGEQAFQNHHKFLSIKKARANGVSIFAGRFNGVKPSTFDSH